MKKINALTVMVLVSVLGLAACNLPPVTVSVLPTPVSVIPTATSQPTSTWTPTTTSSPTPTETSTATPTSRPATTPCPIPTPGGPVGQIVFSAVECTGDCEPAEGDVADIYIINNDGRELYRLVEGLVKMGASIAVSPDRHYLAFVDTRQDLDPAAREPSHIYVLDIASQQVWPLMADQPDESSIGEPQWFPDSPRLAYVGGTANDYGNVSQADIYIITFDGTERLRVTNRPSRSSIASLAISPDGSKIAFVGWLFDSEHSEATVYCTEVAGDGLYELAALPTARINYMRWSPRGNWVLVAVPPEARGGPSRLLLSSSDGSATQELAQVPGYIKDVRWSPGGEFVDALAYHLDGSLAGYRVDLDQDEPQELFRIESGQSWGEYRWSPDDSQVAFSKSFPVGGNIEQRGVYVVDVTSGEWRQILSGYNVWDIAWLSDAP